ncbi:uncharacterized protein LOC101238333 isoform X4 [Hydra vulgaris]|uniref:Uncharacterized protein LOC101238333 isoform X4 n=1 Tax=Hydra vulgaris TaxID=6087 RepID=A0ABM4B7Z8_HYDVU
MAKRLKNQKGNVNMDKLKSPTKSSVLNTHASLVFAVSQEKRVYECLLKLAIERINANTALMQWANMEKNTALGDAVSSLYEINVMWSAIQKEFAQESKLLGRCLNEILQSEIELDVIRIQIKENTEKKEKLTKSISDTQNSKCSSKSRSESLKAIEDDVIKNDMLRKSLLSVMESHLKLARDSQSIFLTAIKIIEKIPNFPINLQDQEKIKEHQAGLHNSEEVQKLAKEINLDYCSPSLCHIIGQQAFNKQKNKPIKSNENLLKHSLPKELKYARKKIRSQTASEPLVSSPDHNYLCPTSLNGKEPESDYVKPNCSLLARSSTFPGERKAGVPKISTVSDDENEPSSYYLFDSDNEPIYDKPLESETETLKNIDNLNCNVDRDKQIKILNHCQIRDSEGFIKFLSKESGSSDEYAYDSPEDDSLSDSSENSSIVHYSLLRRRVVNSKKYRCINKISSLSLTKEEPLEKCDSSVSQPGYNEPPEIPIRIPNNTNYNFGITENNDKTTKFNNTCNTKTDVLANRSSAVLKKTPLRLPVRMRRLSDDTDI